MSSNSSYGSKCGEVVIAPSAEIITSDPVSSFDRPIGTFVFSNSSRTLFQAVDRTVSAAGVVSVTWRGTGVSDLDTLTGDTGGAVSSDSSGNISILGGPGVQVAGTPANNRLTVNLDADQTFSSVTSTTFATAATASGLEISGNTLAGEGTDTDIDVNVTPKGNGSLLTGNLSLNGNTIASTDTNGNVNLTPDGTGRVSAANLDVNSVSVTAVIRNEGTFTLTAGVATVADANIAAGDHVSITRTDINSSTALGLPVVAITPSTNFVVTSVQAGTPAATETNDVSIFTYTVSRAV